MVMVGELLDAELSKTVVDKMSSSSVSDCFVELVLVYIDDGEAVVEDTVFLVVLVAVVKLVVVGDAVKIELVFVMIFVVVVTIDGVIVAVVVAVVEAL